MKKIIVLMIVVVYSKEMFALQEELKNLSVSLTELQKKLSLQEPSPGSFKTVETNQRTALLALETDLKHILERIIDPYRVFSSEQEREVFYYFIIEESLNSAKVVELMAQKKYSPNELEAWYKQGKLPEMTQGTVSQLAYKHYLARDEWRPLPPVPGQAQVKSSFDEARELKEKLLEVMQAIISQNAAVSSAQGAQSFKDIFDRALKGAMAEWQLGKKVS